ncbi:hypothetical protein CV102_12860 [Natronococcus pandeyae]|uniref:DUF7344 domain-containing protein n=1 Tax=Natronococcus pandeyae TaxID=2055836 RepID=A0A8J8TS17_9EURY|nr:hypothetical protein [Natronococcus pandeyae]TYL38092.1 hypothetical protein CV102_12860 [Natronococcus pandeyae]
MTTEITHGDASDTHATLSPTTVFELLLDERRRHALYYLSRHVGAVSIEELVDGVARMDGKPTRQRLDALAVEFHHNHLDRLAEAGVLRYDRDAETVERRPTARALDPHLELVYGEGL